MTTVTAQPVADLPLQGKTIVVTRPEAQAEPLAAAIRAQGGEVLCYPLLEIAPPADLAPLQQVAGQLESFTLAIFISPNAVDYSLPALLAVQPWPPGLIPAAVGQGTVKTLARYGINGCVAPTQRFDSESLLECPELHADKVAGKRVALFRGDGGRELLADTLRERGATVSYIPCYRRLPPSRDIQCLMVAWQARQLSALTISSSEGLRYLLDKLDPAGQAYLKQTPVFVPHARIAENAMALGLQRVILTAGADAGILQGLCKYRW